MSERSSVNILGSNCPEWYVSYLGAVGANYIAAGVHTTDRAEGCMYVAEHSEAEIIVMETNEQFTNYTESIN